MKRLPQELLSSLPESFYGKKGGATPFYSPDHIEQLYPELNLPYSTYRGIIAELAFGQLEGAIRFIQFDQRAYEKWLQDESREDSEMARIDWADAVDASPETARQREIAIAMFESRNKLKH